MYIVDGACGNTNTLTEGGRDGEHSQDTFICDMFVCLSEVPCLFFFTTMTLSRLQHVYIYSALHHGELWTRGG